MPDTAEQQSWTDVFKRSRLCRGVFNITDDGEPKISQVLRDAGLPQVTQISLFSHAYGSAALLDGWVIRISPYGFGAGDLPAGSRLVGYRPFRLLCHLLDLSPPRRLKGEPEIPLVEDLLEEFGRQRALPSDDLEALASRGLGVSDRSSLRNLVYEQWGEALTPLDDEIKRTIRPENEWGDAGFSMWEQEQYEMRGITFTEAQGWQELDTSIGLLDELHGFGLEEIQRWSDAELRPVVALEFLTGRGLPRPLSLGEVQAFMDVGIEFEPAIFGLVRAGFGPEQGVEYLNAGVRPSDVGQFAEIGALPSDVADLFANGLTRGWEASRLHHEGWTLDDMKRRPASDRQEVFRHFRY